MDTRSAISNDWCANAGSWTSSSVPICLWTKMAGSSSPVLKPQRRGRIAETGGTFVVSIERGCRRGGRPWFAQVAGIIRHSPEAIFISPKCAELASHSERTPDPWQKFARPAGCRPFGPWHLYTLPSNDGIAVRLERNCPPCEGWSNDM